MGQAASWPWPALSSRATPPSPCRLATCLDALSDAIFSGFPELDGRLLSPVCGKPHFPPPPCARVEGAQRSVSLLGSTCRTEPDATCGGVRLLSQAATNSKGCFSTGKVQSATRPWRFHPHLAGWPSKASQVGQHKRALYSAPPAGVCIQLDQGPDSGRSA